ncbi:MAG: glycosyltransferase family 4 protein [Burkholderiales bacterium]|nr:glycosyltransferase family 4 protein [Burkholderiales bacterium]
MNKPVIQLNLSTSLGGAEVYSLFFSKALAAAGFPTTLLVDSRADFWDRFDQQGFEIRKVGNLQEAIEQIPNGSLLVNHSDAPREWLSEIMQRAHVSTFAHHALTPHNRYDYYMHCHVLIPVSRYVIHTCEAHGFKNVYPEPLLGVADMRRDISATDIRANGVYLWETRKGRDWLLSKVYPTYLEWRPRRHYVKRAGLTLGVVSRIANMKQFPELFRLLLPALREHPNVYIEFFGSGYYRKVRAVERVLRPLGSRVRWWGWQSDIAAIYGQIDFLLTGLPEREALGLNVIEAQMCGTPVLAVNAPPFNETVKDGTGGLLYVDPRQDGGEDFRRLLAEMVAGRLRPDPLSDPDHLTKFGFDAYVARVRRLIDSLTTAPPS